jgi:hypothetical protein
MIKYLKQIVGFLLVAIVASSVFAQDRLHCPRIRNDQRPALLFIRGSQDERELCVANFEGEDLHKDIIMSSRYLQVNQLDNAIFLVTAQRSPTKGSVYAMDLGRGIVKLIAKSTRIRCLRAEPRMKKAMLVDANMGIGEVRLIELNLANLETTLRHTLKKELLVDRFNGIGPRMKLSPDFKHIVYASRKSDKVPERWSEYILRVLDLSTMMIEGLDNDVGVQISVLSSRGSGSPPFEWINSNEVIYQDMVPNKPNEISEPALQALNIFKSVNIKTKKVMELFRKELRLTLDGGSLQANPLNGKLIYNREYILDLEKKSLTQKDLPFSIMPSLHTKPTKILHGKDILYSGKASCVYRCISASGKNFAYLLHRTTASPNSLLYAKFEHEDKPVKVGEGTYWPTRPIAWIE